MGLSARIVAPDKSLLRRSGRDTANSARRSLVSEVPFPAAFVDSIERRFRLGLRLPAREPAVVVGGRQGAPALVGLALDVGLGGFALVVERVEVLLEALVAGDARVDRAADGFWRFILHGLFQFRRR